MKNARTAMSARYLAALRAHLRRKRPDGCDRAQGLGRAALAGGLVPRDLALVHGRVVLALAASEGFARKPIGSSAHVGAMTRAGFFLSQALLPLIGMRERIEMVGGNLVVASKPGVGTTVRAEIPFDTGNKET